MSRSVPVLLSTPAAMMYCSAAAALHYIHGGPGGVAAVVALLANYFLASSIALWIVIDARAAGCTLPYDFDSLVFFAPFIVAPIYLFHMRGLRAFIPIGLFILLILGAVLAVILPSFIAAVMLRHVTT